MIAEKEEENKRQSPESMKPGSLSSHIKQLGKHGAVYGLGSVMYRVVGFLMIPIYAHYLTPADYGVLQLIYITTEAVSILFGLRLSTTVFRLYHEADTPEEKNLVISTALIGVLGLGILLISPLMLMSPWLAGFILEGKGQGVLLRIALASLWLQFPVNIAMSYLQIKEKSLIYVGISIARLILSVVLNIYFVVVLRTNVMGILIASLLVDIASWTILVPWLVSRCGFKFSSPWFREMMRFGLPLVPSSLASMVTHMSDRYFIRAYLSVAATGVYSLGYKMGNSIHGFFYVPFSQIWNTRRFVIEKEPDAKRIYAKVCTYFIVIMGFVGLGMSLFAKDIVKIISSREYWDAGAIIPLVVLSYVVYAMEDHLSTGIWLKKRTERISVVVLLSGAVNIGLNFVLIPYLGMYGAVLSTLLSFVVRNVGLYYLSNQLYPIPFEWGRLSFIFGISIILYLIGNSFQGLNLWVGVLTDLGLWICFPLVVYVFILDREEKEGVKNILGFIRQKTRLHFFMALKARAKEYWG